MRILPPPVGTSLAGYFEDRFSTAIHDPLHARALVVESGGRTAAIVCCDLVRVGRPIVERARALASRATGIDEGAILISATHTHTGPDTVVRNVQLNEAYLEELPDRIARALGKAHSAMQAATLRLGEESDHTARIRRFRMKGGREAFNPGFLNPNIMGPVGEIDPQVNLLRADDESGEPIALLGNYAMHPDVLGGYEISADWPGEVCRILQESYDGRPIALYAQGACGNTCHINVTKPGPQMGWTRVREIARTLAGKMIAASESSRPMETDIIRVASRTLQIPYHPLTPELISQAKRIREMANPHAFDRR